MQESRPEASFFWRRQGLHLVGLVVLLAGVYAGVDGGALKGAVAIWFGACLAIPIAHQWYVWWAWRSELCFGSLSKRLGEKAFVLYGVVFRLFLLSRPVLMLGLAYSDRGSLPLAWPVQYGLSTLLALPALYTFYSVGRYFPIKRAMGIDHFDPSYRDKPLVKKGIFRFSQNAMYAYGFMLFWAIALAFASRQALVASAFCHAYIWLHYFCTEQPDMEFLYGAPASESNG